MRCLRCSWTTALATFPNSNEPRKKSCQATTIESLRSGGQPRVWHTARQKKSRGLGHQAVPFRVSSWVCNPASRQRCGRRTGHRHDGMTGGIGPPAFTCNLHPQIQPTSHKQARGASATSFCRGGQSEPGRSDGSHGSSSLLGNRQETHRLPRLCPLLPINGRFEPSSLGRSWLLAKKRPPSARSSFNSNKTLAAAGPSSE